MPQQHNAKGRVGHAGMSGPRRLLDYVDKPNVNVEYLKGTLMNKGKRPVFGGWEGIWWGIEKAVGSSHESSDNNQHKGVFPGGIFHTLT